MFINISKQRKSRKSIGNVRWNYHVSVCAHELLISEPENAIVVMDFKNFHTLVFFNLCINEIHMVKISNIKNHVATLKIFRYLQNLNEF